MAEKLELPRFKQLILHRNDKQKERERERKGEREGEGDQDDLT